MGCPHLERLLLLAELQDGRPDLPEQLHGRRLLVQDVRLLLEHRLHLRLELREVAPRAVQRAAGSLL